MDLKTAVDRYLEYAGSFGVAMPLSGFEVSKQELEATLSAWDEDYHLHRHFELIALAPSASANSGDAATYVVNGFPYHAIVFKETVRHVLA